MTGLTLNLSLYAVCRFFHVTVAGEVDLQGLIVLPFCILPKYLRSLVNLHHGQTVWIMELLWLILGSVT